jgi:hypothetical protein
VFERLVLLGIQVLQNQKKYHGPHSHDILLDLFLLEGEFLQLLHNKPQLQVPMWYVELEGLLKRHVLSQLLSIPEGLAE